MEAQKLGLLFLIFQFIFFVPKSLAQLYQFKFSLCGNITYTPNSTYQTNLETVLNSISSDTRITHGYYNFTAGQGPNKVEAMVRCRGDVPVNACRLCAQSSIPALVELCPYEKQAYGINDNCIIFYSHNSTLHTIRKRPLWILFDDKRNVSSVEGFNNSLYGLLSTLQKQASLGNSELKYATGETNVTGTNHTIYGLIQCNPTFSRLDCVACVDYLLSFFPTYLVRPSYITPEARLESPSCCLRYDIKSFYGKETEVAPPPSTPLPVPPTTNKTQVERSKKSYRTIVVIVPIVGLLAVIMIIASVCITLRKKLIKISTLSKEEIDALDSIQYSLGSIKAATGDFSDENKLGEGGFGIVYKGKLPNEQEIAVKRLAKNSVQGATQFKNEILLLAKLQHRNLVRLVGFCLENEEMLLIYEFVVNKSLDNYLFGTIPGASMSWETRFKIINGVARGLHYLHEDSRLRIIHRDLKAANVLLDAQLNPKIADFGMARLFSIDQTQAAASKIVGTYGYMAPEYVLHGQVSTKSDVFSFGVLVLEIVSGQRISSFKIGQHPENMLTFAWKNWLEGTAWNLVDPTLSTTSSNEILKCIHIGLLCVQHNMADRPTMSSVDLMLSSVSISLQVPSQPAFFSRGHPSQNEPSLEYLSDQSSSTLPCTINDVSVTQVYPR